VIITLFNKTIPGRGSWKTAYRLKRGAIAVGARIFFYRGSAGFGVYEGIGFRKLREMNYYYWNEKADQ